MSPLVAVVISAITELSVQRIDQALPAQRGVIGGEWGFNRDRIGFDEQPSDKQIDLLLNMAIEIS